MAGDLDAFVLRLESHLREQVSDRGPACIAAVGRDSRIPKTVWVPGSLGSEPGVLAYSVTKTFIAVLVLLLEQEGRLTLDDSLSRWFAGIDRASRITLRMLLNHTAGVPDYGALRAYHEAVRNSPTEPWKLEQFAACTWKKGLVFEPGTSW